MHDDDPPLYDTSAVLESVAHTLAREVTRAIEHKLVETVERRLGRVPSNAEVAAHGYCYVHPDRTVYTWAGEPLFELRMKWDAMRPRIEFREFVPA